MTSKAASSLLRSCVLRVAASGPAASSPATGAATRSVCRRVLLASSSTWTSGSLHTRSNARRRSVSPSLRQRRPLVNGEAVAFYIEDLEQPYEDDSPLHKKDASSTQEFESDLVVVLDMDECLIHSKFLNTPAERYTHQVHQNKARRARKVDSFRLTLADGETALVHQRPHLKEFLDFCTSRYETHIFTAAMEEYAKPLLDILDPQRKLSGRWYREACEFDSSLGAFSKNLELIGKPMDRIVLVDNNPFSFLTHPQNGILVTSFFDDPNDTSLIAVQDLLKQLEDHKDVRPLLEQRFGLEAALDDIRSGADVRQKLWKPAR